MHLLGYKIYLLSKSSSTLPSFQPLRNKFHFIRIQNSYYIFISKKAVATVMERGTSKCQNPMGRKISTFWMRSLVSSSRVVWGRKKWFSLSGWSLRPRPFYKSLLLRGRARGRRWGLRTLLAWLDISSFLMHTSVAHI